MPQPDGIHMGTTLVHALGFAIVMLIAGGGWTEDIGGPGPLRLLTLDELAAILPLDARLMIRPVAIEQFLTELDGDPPDWAAVFGHGHHDPEHDDRLFALNRERDARREGHPALAKYLTFVWTGELSRYDPVTGGFPVALGPTFTKTRWGMVRFKPEEVPGNLIATTDPDHRRLLQARLERGQPVEIDVVMTGRLIPQESIVYDFSHDEEGVGLIMPFVRVERVDFVMKP